VFQNRTSSSCKTLPAMPEKRTLNKIILGLTIVILSSCATSFNTKKTRIRFHTEKSIEVVKIDNAILADKNDYIVMRSFEDLKVNIAMDSVDKTIFIRPKQSFVYWENFLNLGIGFLVDNNTIKRFSYPKQIYLEKRDSSINIVNYPTVRKSSIELCFLLPYFNSFSIRKNDGFYFSTGFLGIGGGINYYYKDNNYVSINVGSSLDYGIPIPVGADYFGDYKQHCSIIFLNIRNHIRYNHFDVGYGLAYSSSKWGSWQRGDSITNQDITLSKINSNLGLSLNVKYHLFKFASVGVIYQPSFIEFNSSPTFGYQDFITLEAAVSLNIRRQKK
jgi:hypothetical protein